jgi:hypothetical protein
LEEVVSEGTEVSSADSSETAESRNLSSGHFLGMTKGSDIDSGSNKAEGISEDRNFLDQLRPCSFLPDWWVGTILDRIASLIYINFD